MEEKPRTISRDFEFSETPEKYMGYGQKIVSFLVETLEAANIIEEEAYKREEILRQRKKEKGLEHQYLPEDKEIHNDFYEKRMKLAERTCTGKVLKKTYCNSFGYPTEYDGVRIEGRQIIFTMKKAALAKIALKWKFSIEKEIDFKVRIVDGEYRIDEIKHIFGSLGNMTMGL